jgi:hypothetical protein
MADSNFGGVYDTGTIDLVHGDVHVVGHGLYWADVLLGDWLTSVDDGSTMVIASVDKINSTLELQKGWPGTTATGTQYVITRMSWLRYDPSALGAKVREFITFLEQQGFIYSIRDPLTVPDPDVGEDGQFAVKIDNGPWLFWERVGDVWESRVPPVGGTVYDFGGWSPDRPGTQEKVISLEMVRAANLPTSYTGSKSRARTAATSTTIFTIKRITQAGVSTDIGTITFDPGGTVGTFAGAGVTLAAGDVIDVVAPVVRDATIADVYVTFAGTRL